MHLVCAANRTEIIIVGFAEPFYSLMYKNIVYKKVSCSIERYSGSNEKQGLDLIVHS